MYVKDHKASSDERQMLVHFKAGDCFRRLGRVWIKTDGKRNMPLVGVPLCLAVELQTGELQAMPPTEFVEPISIVTTTTGKRAS